MQYRVKRAEIGTSRGGVGDRASRGVAGEGVRPTLGCQEGCVEEAASRLKDE